ncbi:MAG: c-type cytochrome [Planctomycetia bacterium]|nr:c-type cytochrome [Planctomycetia bacterium]
MNVLLLPRTLAALAIGLLFTNSARAVDDPQWKLPPGFTIELVAGPPLVNHPTMGGFDDQGRLYICDGPGDNMRAAELLEKLPNNIRRLEDTDGDGRFDKSTMFADKMTFPMGALWHDGYVYTASPPHIWRLRDADGDGIAEERKILVSEFGFTGNAADIHGCFLGPDGRIYWCDGRHGHTFTDAQGKTLSKGLAARIFSCKPDGSDVQAFAGGGMDNPVEVCFTEEGEMLGTVAIFDNKPDRVDAIVHWVYGGAYPYFPKVLDEFKRTGDLLPAVSRFGRVAPSGILRYRGNQLGTEYTGNLFHAQFNTHRIVRTKLERSGATFKSKDEDFLVSENQDVHLTDVIEDADGSLLVVDTGGWFRIGCPNSQIAKPELLGGIYRIRRTGTAKPSDPRGLKMKWTADVSNTTLLRRLKDERWAVQDRVKDEFVRRGKKDKQVGEFLYTQYELAENLSTPLMRDIVWTLSRIGGPEELEYLDLLSAADGLPESTAQAICVALASHRDQSRGIVFRSDDLAVRRDVAMLCGRMKGEGDDPLFPELLKGIEPDRFLEHAVIYGLIERQAEDQALLMLEDEEPPIARAGLIALDQMGKLTDNLETAQLVKFLDSPDAPLQSATLGVVQKHPAWAAEVIAWLKTKLAAPALPAEQAPLVANTLVAYKLDPTIQQLIADTLVAAKTSPATRRMLLETMALSELTGPALPKPWTVAVAKSLHDADEAVARQALATTAVVGGAAGPFDADLKTLAAESTRSAEFRVAALKTLAARVGAVDGPTFAFLLDRLRTAPDSLDKLAAADVLGLAALAPPQRTALVEAVAKAGPMELPALLTQFEKDSSADEGVRLIAALALSPGLDNVSATRLEKLVAPYPPEVREAAKPLLKRINGDLETQRARLAELIAQIDGGDIARGRMLFGLQKTACSSCHKVGAGGANIGPELTKVGQIRSPVDILESVLYPSASFVRGYESVSVTTSAGLERSGILSRETPEAIYLKTAQREEVRIPRGDVDEIQPGKLSIMPQGLDKVMTLDELRDLVAYLKSLK